MLRRIGGWAVATGLLIGVLALAWIVTSMRLAPSRDQMDVMMTSALIKRDRPGGEDKCLFPFVVEPDATSRAFRAVLLGTEDRDFGDHWFGISGRGLAAAVWHGGQRRGGSSIAQQLVKNVMFEPGDNRWARKAFEIPWTVVLGLRFSKSDILKAYLNHVPFKHGIYGVEAASLFYFSKNASSLNYAEAALLEVMLASPRYDLASEDPAVRQRTRDKARALLVRLVGDSVLVKAALADRVTPGAARMPPVDCGYVRDFVMREAAARGWTPAADNETFRIFLTVDPGRQAIARNAADEAGDTLQRHSASQLALVDLDRAGRVLALQGGVDYQISQFNRAADTRRSPGSVGKVIVLAEACEQGIALGDAVDDDALLGGHPRNDGGRYYGKTTLRFAFDHSLNAAFFRLAQKLGPQNVATRARAFGLTGTMPTDGGVAVGDFATSPLQMTAAIDTVAAGGVYHEPYAVVGITSNLGRIAYWRGRAPPGKRVLSARCVAMVDKAMRDVVLAGTGWRANIDAARGKTGTTNAYRDAWFIGYTGPAVVGVWVGNDDQRVSMRQVEGGGIPATLFSSYIRKIDWVKGHHRPIQAFHRTKTLPVS